jgi:hypothetical protein
MNATTTTIARKLNGDDDEPAATTATPPPAKRAMSMASAVFDAALPRLPGSNATGTGSLSKGGATNANNATSSAIDTVAAGGGSNSNKSSGRASPIESGASTVSASSPNDTTPNNDGNGGDGTNPYTFGAVRPGSMQAGRRDPLANLGSSNSGSPGRLLTADGKRRPSQTIDPSILAAVSSLASSMGIDTGLKSSPSATTITDATSATQSAAGSRMGSNVNSRPGTNSGSNHNGNIGNNNGSGGNNGQSLPYVDPMHQHHQTYISLTDSIHAAAAARDQQTRILVYLPRYM